MIWVRPPIALVWVLISSFSLNCCIVRCGHTSDPCFFKHNQNRAQTSKGSNVGGQDMVRDIRTFTTQKKQKTYDFFVLVVSGP